jgi:fructokinase
MIAVTGEALIDLVIGTDGQVAAQPGGGPFNTARTVARLGLASMFLGRLSGDGFGRVLRDRLERDGVTLGIPAPTSAPTTLAAVDVDPAGVAQYHFYLTGTSAAELDYPLLSGALPPDVTALHAGTLALIMEPAAASIERLITTGLRPGILVMVDPNCRPPVITDRQAYLDRLDRILRRADMVKVSADDLAYLFGDLPVAQAAASLLGQGPAIVLVTDGPRTAQAYLPGEVVTVDVPQVEVVDTIGAGDAFGGAFLAWWTGQGLTRADLARTGLVRAALEVAVEVASLTCTRMGAEPPWRAEVTGWQSAPDGRPKQPLT